MNFSGHVRSKCFKNPLVPHPGLKCTIVVNNDSPSPRKHSEVGNAGFPSIIITDQVSLVLRVKYLDSRPSTFIALPLNLILKALSAFSGMSHSLSIGVEAHLLQLSTPVVFVWITSQNRADSLFWGAVIE